MKVLMRVLEMGIYDVNGKSEAPPAAAERLPP